MNEAIGVKGGRNDRKRIRNRKRIEKKKRQKEQELKELEKEVQRKQKWTFIKVLPIVILTGTIQSFYEPKKKEIKTKKIIILEENQNKKEKKKEIPITIQIPVVTLEKEFIPEEKIIKTKNIVKPKENKKQEETLPKQEIKEKKQKEPLSKKDPIQVILPKEKKQSFKQESQKEFVEEKKESKINQLKSIKIVEYYENELKQVRYELRNLSFDYQMLLEEEKNSITEKEIDQVLDKLSFIIQKIEMLKEKMDIENRKDYDDNYIYTLIEEYLREFQDKRFVKEVKDSPLYITIVEKLEEMNQMKSSFQKKVEEKKKKSKEKEEKFQKIKKKYYDMERMNQALIEFQYEQDMKLKEIQKKIDQAVTEEEKTRIKIEGLDFQSKRLLRLLTLSMFLRGPKSAKQAAFSTATYLYFAKKIKKPKQKVERYRMITVKDYKDEIESSIDSIIDTKRIVNKTEKELEKMIVEIKTEMKEYLSLGNEYQSLLSHLETIKSEMKEKSYELEQIQKKQEKELERNNAKVLKRGEYPL